MIIKNKLNIVFTDHSLERMEERLINKEIIKSLINNINENLIDIGIEKVYSFNNINIIDFLWNNNLSSYDMDCLKNINIVGILEDDNTFVVITAYFDEKNHNLKKLKDAVSSRFIRNLKRNLNFDDLLKGKGCI